MGNSRLKYGEYGMHVILSYKIMIIMIIARLNQARHTWDAIFVNLSWKKLNPGGVQQGGGGIGSPSFGIGNPITRIPCLLKYKMIPATTP